MVDSLSLLFTFDEHSIVFATILVLFDTFAVWDAIDEVSSIGHSPVRVGEGAEAIELGVLECPVVDGSVGENIDTIAIGVSVNEVSLVVAPIFEMSDPEARRETRFEFALIGGPQQSG